jgi:hypothetical protein
MLRTVGKKVGQIYINPVELQFFLRPAKQLCFFTSGGDIFGGVKFLKSLCVS